MAPDPIGGNLPGPPSQGLPRHILLAIYRTTGPVLQRTVKARAALLATHPPPAADIHAWAAWAEYAAVFAEPDHDRGATERVAAE